jgi:hypothetical protein
MDVRAGSGAVRPVGHDQKRRFSIFGISAVSPSQPLTHIREPVTRFAGALTMKKPLLSIDEPEPKKPSRADRPPTEGFATIVDGHFKSEFDTAEAAEAAGRKLKSAYPYLQIEIYDSAMKVRTLVPFQEES